MQWTRVKAALRNGLFAVFAFSSSTRYLSELPLAVPMPSSLVFAADGRMSRHWMLPIEVAGCEARAAEARRVGEGELECTFDHFFSNPSSAHDGSLPAPRGLHSDASAWAKHLDGREAAATAAARPRLLMCGCCMELRESRAAKLAALVANGFACDAAGGRAGVGRDEYVELLLSSRFVFSPAGNGLANHRDWEALSAGAVPLVDASAAHAPLWRGLPVLQVANWSHVTPRFLEAEWRRVEAARARGELRLEKLWWPWWLHRLTRWYDQNLSVAYREERNFSWLTE